MNYIVDVMKHFDASLKHLFKTSKVCWPSFMTLLYITILLNFFKPIFSLNVHNKLEGSVYSPMILCCISPSCLDSHCCSTLGHCIPSRDTVHNLQKTEIWMHHQLRFFHTLNPTLHSHSRPKMRLNFDRQTSKSDEPRPVDEMSHV